MRETKGAVQKRSSAETGPAENEAEARRDGTGPLTDWEFWRTVEGNRRGRGDLREEGKRSGVETERRETERSRDGAEGKRSGAQMEWTRNGANRGEKRGHGAALVNTERNDTARQSTEWS